MTVQKEILSTKDSSINQNMSSFLQRMLHQSKVLILTYIAEAQGWLCQSQVMYIDTLGKDSTTMKLTWNL